MMELTIKQIIKAVAGHLMRGDPNSCVKGVSTDSRTIVPGELFIALKGERFDGHSFISESLVQKASALLVNRKSNLQEVLPPECTIPIIEVNDTLTALGDLANAWMNHTSAVVIAITGSNGKTTTREMTASILEQTHQVLKPQHNWNNLIGLPLTLLRLDHSHEIAVIEMGMNRLGEIRRLAQIAQPHLGLITNISPAHLHDLKTVKNVAQAKGELFEALTADDYAVVNNDDPLVIELAQGSCAKKITYGLNGPAEITGTDIILSPQYETCFTLHRADKGIPIILKIPGTHIVYNALAAAAIATHFGLSLQTIKRGLEQFTAFPGRMETIPISNNITLINDTYNANPLSMEKSLRTLVLMSDSGRAIAVLGDMLELGDSAHFFHQQLGVLLTKLNLSAVFLMGPHAHVVAESARSHGMNQDIIHSSNNHQQVARQLDQYVRAHDVILFKGSRGMHIEKCLEQFLLLRNTGSSGSATIKTVQAGSSC
jgi:UDP-N-acetylmuramoyl-tripeptide--D-alanyl-D-alanine ligase